MIATTGQEPKKCEVAGHQIAYWREGEGEPVLLVHGITTYSFIWRLITPFLTPRFDVIAVDLLGCGDSDKPLDVPYSIKNHTEVLREFMERLGIEKFHYVGHDIGGGIGQLFAAKYPERLYDLALLNAVAYDFWPVQPIIAMRTPVIRLLMMAALDHGTFRLFVQRALFHKEKLTPELMEFFGKAMKTKEGRKGFLHFAKSLDNRDLMAIKEELRGLKIPVLIIRGDADVFLSDSIALTLHSEIPGSQLVRIPTAGHFVQEDEPEQTGEAILRFLEENVNARNS